MIPLPAAVLLVAHGSADPRAAATTRALAAALASARPGRLVRCAYLDHSRPGPDAAVRALAATGVPGVTVVPLLLTAAYHRRVDLPTMLARVQERGPAVPLRVTDVLGPADGVVPQWLLAGLCRRLAAATGEAAVDAVVLAAAGTRDAAARTTVEEVAAALGERLGVPCRAGYASAATPDPGGAVAALRAGGARRVGVAGYFLATGQLYRAAAASARRAGAVAVARPLATTPELVRLILSRLDAAEETPLEGDRPFAGVAVGG